MKLSTADENTREQAIRFTMGVLLRASDWQEGQHALADPLALWAVVGRERA